MTSYYRNKLILDQRWDVHAFTTRRRYVLLESMVAICIGSKIYIVILRFFQRSRISVPPKSHFLSSTKNQYINYFAQDIPIFLAFYQIPFSQGSKYVCIFIIHSLSDIVFSLIEISTLLHNEHVHFTE